MKKSQILAVALLASAMSAAAVGAQAIGFKLGPTFADLNVNDDALKGSSLLDLGGGGFVRFGFGKYSLQPEVLHLNKGSNVTGSRIAGEVKLRFAYIEVPILARYNIGNGLIESYLMAGPSFSFETKCSSAVREGSTLPSACSEGGAIAGNRKKFDLGAALVAGVDFQLGPGNMILEGRYTHGLSDIAASATEELHNRMFGILAGYSIRRR